MKKNLLLVAVVLLITIPLFLWLLLRSSTPSSSPQSEEAIATPTPIPGETSADRFIRSVQNPTPLPEQTADKKAALLSTLSEPSGVIDQTSSYQIVYLSSPDVFQIEILSSNVQQAKQDAKQYFLDQGFSENEICSLKIMYFLTYDLMQEYKQSGKTFNVLPEGC